MVSDPQMLLARGLEAARDQVADRRFSDDDRHAFRAVLRALLRDVPSLARITVVAHPAATVPGETYVWELRLDAHQVAYVYCEPASGRWLLYVETGLFALTGQEPPDEIELCAATDVSSAAGLRRLLAAEPVMLQTARRRLLRILIGLHEPLS